VRSAPRRDAQRQHRAFIEAALEDSSLEDLRAYADIIEQRIPPLRGAAA
jgi:hypothetical protein